MKPMSLTSFKQLVVVLREIEISKATGILNCQSVKESCCLCFTKGKLVHVYSGDRGGRVGKEVVAALLNWTEGSLSFKETTPHSQQTITMKDLAEIVETLVHLQNEGVFDSDLKEKITPTKVLPQMFDRTALPVSCGSYPIRATKPVEEVSLLTEKSFGLPPSIRQNQLEDLLKQKSIAKQLQFLSETNFTGYVFYNFPQIKSIYGLGLFINGDCTDIILHQSDKQADLKNQEAYQKLAKLVITPQICKVDERILRSYRALVACA
jgi:Domain of unknown function (DUF4388)